MNGLLLRYTNHSNDNNVHFQASNNRRTTSPNIPRRGAPICSRAKNSLKMCFYELINLLLSQPPVRRFGVANLSCDIHSITYNLTPIIRPEVKCIAHCGVTSSGDLRIIWDCVTSHVVRRGVPISWNVFCTLWRIVRQRPRPRSVHETHV